MTDMKLKRGDIVLYHDHNVTYTGLIFRVGNDDSGKPMYCCKFYNRSNGLFGRNIWKFASSLDYIGSIPEGAEWDVRFAA